MTFDKKLTLLKITTQKGSGAQTVTATRTIWANVRDIGVTTKYTAVAAGKNAELQAICHRDEAKGYTHAEYLGARYKIESTGAADNDRHIKLILAKGG